MRIILNPKKFPRMMYCFSGYIGYIGYIVVFIGKKCNLGSFRKVTQVTSLFLQEKADLGRGWLSPADDARDAAASPALMSGSAGPVAILGVRTLTETFPAPLTFASGGGRGVWPGCRADDFTTTTKSGYTCKT